MNAISIKTQTRERTHVWSDPAGVADLAGQVSGLEFLQDMVAGKTDGPPIAHTLGFRITAAEKGRVVFEMEPREFHYNPIGSMHGGVISTLLDSALGCAVHTSLKAGSGYTSLEIKVNFVRPITIRTGRIICEGRLLASGRTTALAEGDIRDERGRLLAHASTTCALFRGNG